MIYFNEAELLLNDYKGSELKLAVLYNGEKYMIKFPDPTRKKNAELSYINNVFSEYVGCHVFEVLGFDVQKTFIGKYLQENGKEKIVCACKDYNVPGKKVYEFGTLQLGNVDSEKKPENDLEDIMNTIECNKKYDIFNTIT